LDRKRVRGTGRRDFEHHQALGRVVRETSVFLAAPGAAFARMQHGPGRRNLRRGANMFQQILLPTDGSDLSERAVLAGISFAKEVGAKVVALTVRPEFHTFTYKTEMLEDTEPEFNAATQKQADQYLKFVTDAASSAGVPCIAVQNVSDDPYESILQTAKERKCDLIVMASHGRRGVKGLLLGSETQKVLVHSDIPVLVYR
jgi:nucleotide-binding universal stress UspA family protein